MRGKLGTVCMLLGAAMIAAALLLFVSNRYEERAADDSAAQICVQLKAALGGGDSAASKTLPDPYDTEMTVKEIDGYGYIGYLSIPSAGLELPVMSTWDYERLKHAPCRYSGSAKTDDLVICAHNYDRHFGVLKKLAPGDEIGFTDMDGVFRRYSVCAVETLAPGDVDRMENSGYALTLFTCTYGGASRVTVRCDESAN